MIHCDAPGCVRGIVSGKLLSDFGRPCDVCKGYGSLSLHALAERIGENESTLRRVLKTHRNMRPKVTARICGKIMDLIAPTKLKQPELFT